MNIIKAEGAHILSQVLGKCNSLIHLDLGFIYLGDIGAESIANVQPVFTRQVLELAYRLSILEQCYTLKSLYLNCNQIGNEGTKSIAKNLGKCPSLECINLSWNEIKEDGAMNLAENLLNCWTLKYINLSYNKINKLGTNALTKVHHLCPSIIYFDISNQKKN